MKIVKKVLFIMLLFVLLTGALVASVYERKGNENKIEVIKKVKIYPADIGRRGVTEYAVVTEIRRSGEIKTKEYIVGKEEYKEAEKGIGMKYKDFNRKMK